VAKEIQNNQFTIVTSKPGVKVSWQVTGIRQDAYAKAHGVKVEEENRLASADVIYITTGSTPRMEKSAQWTNRSAATVHLIRLHAKKGNGSRVMVVPEWRVAVTECG
jgi:hypothetical protein